MIEYGWDHTDDHMTTPLPMHDSNSGSASNGKSTVGITFCAHVSTGRTWPDGTPCPPGDAVIVRRAEVGPMARTVDPEAAASWAAAGDSCRDGAG